MIKTTALFLALIFISVGLVFSDAGQNDLLFHQGNGVKSGTQQNGKAVLVSEFQEALFTPEQLAKAKEIIAGVAEEEKAEVKAKAKFNVFCAACHGLKGDLEMNGSKNLRKSTLTFEETVAQIYFGSGMMTPFSEIMTDAEMVAVAEFLATWKE